MGGAQRRCVAYWRQKCGPLGLEGGDGLDIRHIGTDGVQAAAPQAVPRRLSADRRFLDILALWQDDGVVAKDAAAPAPALTEVQAAALRESFDINEMASFSGKRALLNQLVTLGALTAQEAELSTMQLLPRAGPGGGGLGSLPAGFDTMMEDPDYRSHLRRAIEFDGLLHRSDDVRAARQKLYDLLCGVYGGPGQ